MTPYLLHIPHFSHAHMLVQVPSGHNPTGIVLSVERKRQLYAVCQKHDMIIIEDDAYFWLQVQRVGWHLSMES